MELQILHWFESLHNPVTDPIMYAFTMMGEAGILWILLALAMLTLMPKDKYRKVGLTMAFALIFSLIMCNGVMKNAFHRIRPFVEDPTLWDGCLYNVMSGIDDWSFPSGHTSASFAAAVAIFMWRKKEGALALAVAALISLSRLYLTVHYPTDVIASVILGSLYGVAAYFLSKWLFRRFDKINEIFYKGASYKQLFVKKM